MKLLRVDYSGKSINFEERHVPTFRTLFHDENLTVPNDGSKYGYVMHDWQLKKFGYKPRQLNPGYEQKRPVPSTRQLWGRYPFVNKGNGVFDFSAGRVYDRVPFSKEWQYWLLDFLKYTLKSEIPYGKKEYFFDVVYGKRIIVKEHPYAHLQCTEGSLLQSYVNLVEDHRSFTDTTAPENGYTDYVTGRNLGVSKPYLVKPLMTTGNIVKIVGSWDKYYVIETLDLLKPPPPVDSPIIKSLMLWATEQTVDELPPVNGVRRWTVSRYPQLKVASRLNNLTEVGTPFGIFSMGGYNLILKEDVKILNAGEIYSPYEPKK